MSGQRDNNQIVVDISNQMSAVRQARARYSAAANTRALQEQLLEADQKRFASGSATLADLVTDQRNLATAQLSVITAMASTLMRACHWIRSWARPWRKIVSLSTPRWASNTFIL